MKYGILLCVPSDWTIVYLPITGGCPISDIWRKPNTSTHNWICWSIGMFNLFHGRRQSDGASEKEVDKLPMERIDEECTWHEKCWIISFATSRLLARLLLPWTWKSDRLFLNEFNLEGIFWKLKRRIISYL